MPTDWWIFLTVGLAIGVALAIAFPWPKVVSWWYGRQRFADRREPGKVVYKRYMVQMDERRRLEGERRMRQVARAQAEARKRQEAENAAHNS